MGKGPGRAQLLRYTPHTLSEHLKAPTVKGGFLRDSEVRMTGDLGNLR